MASHTSASLHPPRGPRAEGVPLHKQLSKEGELAEAVEGVDSRQKVVSGPQQLQLRKELRQALRVVKILV